MYLKKQMPGGWRQRGAGSSRLAVVLRFVLAVLVVSMLAAPLMAQTGHPSAGEANLILPDLGSATFLGGINGHTLLMGGMVVSALGMVFGLIIFVRLRKMAVHSSMREVSELIYETCKTYLLTQGKFLLVLEAFIGVIIVFYFGFLYEGGVGAFKVVIILLFSVIGISGSFPGGGVRNAREHVRQLAHRVRQPGGEAVSRATTFRSKPA